MVCYIFGASPERYPRRVEVDKQKDDIVICADGGVFLAKEWELVPDWIVGDFDSLDEPDALLGLAGTTKIRRFPTQKDELDLALAIAQGKLLGYREFVVFGALGGRLDHTFAMIQLVHSNANEGCFVKVIGSTCELFCLQQDVATIPNNPTRNRTFSLFALTSQCHGVTVFGSAYPLDNATLCCCIPVGVSNQIIEDVATISLREGVLLVMASRGGG